MILALDVGYQTVDGIEIGVCGVVGFEAWESDEAVYERTVRCGAVKEYAPGKLYQRELPCLEKGLAEARSAGHKIDVVVVDGNVRLDQSGQPGLGTYLYRSLDGAIPVIGVAKNPFAGLQAQDVLRGQSKRPLYVTSVGVDETTAASHISTMAGESRIPILLRRADHLSKV